MRDIIYAVIENQQGHAMFHRFEGVETAGIIDGKKLPDSFQRRLYGPATWMVRKTFSDEFTRTLEGLRLLVGPEKVSGLTTDIFEAGISATVEPVR